MIRKLLQSLVVSAVCMVASHAAAQSVSAISGVSVEVSAAGSELVKFRGQGVGQPRKAFTLANPNRVVIDIDRIPSTSLSLPKNYAGKLIKSIRFGQFNPAKPIPNTHWNTRTKRGDSMAFHLSNGGGSLGGKEGGSSVGSWLMGRIGATPRHGSGQCP